MADEIDAAVQLTHQLYDGLDQADRANDEILWRRIVETGLHEVGLSEEIDGAGGTLGMLCAVVREAARSGLRTPLVEYHIARLLGAPSSADAAEILAVSLDDPGPDCSRARPGRARIVAWGAVARHLVILDRDFRAWKVALPGGAAVLTAVRSFTGSRPATVEPRMENAERLAFSLTPGSFWAEVAVLRAAELNGAAAAALELTDRYVRTRRQFDRPLIALPAVAAGLATARAQVDSIECAIGAAIDRPDNWHVSVAARVVAATAAADVARRAHLLHGAIGTTSEYPLHLFSTQIWESRDAELTERRWAEILGASLSREGEPAFWDLSSVAGSDESKRGVIR